MRVIGMYLEAQVGADLEAAEGGGERAARVVPRVLDAQLLELVRPPAHDKLSRRGHRP